jgi:hypothetical protein
MVGLGRLPEPGKDLEILLLRQHFSTQLGSTSMRHAFREADPGRHFGQDYAMRVQQHDTN